VAWAARAAGPSGPVVATEAAAGVSLPHTEPVLAALAGCHPDPAVAKAARLALWRYRAASAGG
jgi:hypothetical protein